VETEITFSTPLNIGDIVYIVSGNNRFEVAKVRNIKCDNFTLFEVTNPLDKETSQWGSGRNIPIRLSYVLERASGYCTLVDVTEFHQHVGQTYFLSKLDLFNHYFPADNV